MRGEKLTIALLAAAALALGAGSASGQSSQSTTTSPSLSTPPASAASKMPAATAGSKEKSAAQKMSKGSQMPSQAAREEKGEAEIKPDRAYRGTVTAVDTSANPNTLVMNTQVGKQVLTVGVDVPSRTKITEGTAKKSLSDIKAGDHVWMRYDRLTDRLVAEQIRILPPSSKMTKAQKSRESAKATPAAAKSQPPTKSY